MLSASISAHARAAEKHSKLPMIGQNGGKGSECGGPPLGGLEMSRRRCSLPSQLEGCTQHMLEQCSTVEEMVMAGMRHYGWGCT